MVMKLRGGFSKIVRRVAHPDLGPVRWYRCKKKGPDFRALSLGVPTTPTTANGACRLCRASKSGGDRSW